MYVCSWKHLLILKTDSYIFRSCIDEFIFTIRFINLFHPNIEPGDLF